MGMRTRGSVGTGENSAAGESITLANHVPVILTLRDGFLGAVAVHGCERHWDVTEEDLQYPDMTLAKMTQYLAAMFNAHIIV